MASKRRLLTRCYIKYYVDFELPFYQGNLNFQLQIIRSAERITNFVFISFFTLVSGTAILCAITLFYNPVFGMDNFPYHVYFPLFVPVELKLVTMSVAVGWNALLIVAHDCFIMAMMNHVCAQLKILEATFKNLTWTNYKTPPLIELKQCIVHHHMITLVRNEIESIFSYMLLLQFLTSLFIFGLTGFQATVGPYRQFNVYAYCCCISSELFIYCWFANQVLNQVSAHWEYNIFFVLFGWKLSQICLIFEFGMHLFLYFRATCWGTTLTRAHGIILVMIIVVFYK